MSAMDPNATRFHARWSEDRSKPQALRLHLTGVSQRTCEFAHLARPSDSAFGCAAKLAGLLHDLGKYRVAFQKYLDLGDPGRRSIETAHAVYGAAAAGVVWDSSATAFAIAGHHAGLHDRDQLAGQIASQKFHALDRFPDLLCQADDVHELAGALERLKPKSENATDSAARLDYDDNNPADVRRFDVFVRMLFSILVDADRLDSEKFEQEHRKECAWERTIRTLDAGALLARLDIARRTKGLQKKDSRSNLNALRDSIFDACVERARTSLPGFFSLTVPTGGGKTYSSMAFALEHARTHGLRRVIVVIPYLSIIEQNARDYRAIFGADQVLEHHCAVELAPAKPESVHREDEPTQVFDHERAFENWDVPIVVTTAVQFIESLFAAGAGRARKLHNIARSVVIFDEAQTLPVDLLEPTLDVLRILQSHFGVSFLFCSATQPAFRKSANLKQGFRSDEITEIAPRVNDLFAKLQRVTFRIVPETDRWDWKRVAAEMLLRPQALCVVNLRRHAFDVYQALKAGLISHPCFGADANAIFHLSSAMCPAHRLDVLGLAQNPATGNILRRLDPESRLPCWVVSTQLIEAGVDIDFPVVLRAMGPLDSIVQAAGRCNREGRLNDELGHAKLGEVIVFHPAESGLPQGIYERGTCITPPYLADTARLATDSNLFASYFSELFEITPTDRVRRNELTVQALRERLKFRTVGDKAKVIPGDTVSVVVRYRDGARLVERITKARRVDYRILRRLQRYMVSLRRGPKSVFEQLVGAGRLRPLLPELDLLVVDAECYDLRRGIVFNERPPEEFVF